MFVLCFDDGNSQKVLCKNEEMEEINKYMYWYIKDVLKFKSYYSRRWQTNNGVVVDYGSHTNFFLIKSE